MELDHVGTNAFHAYTRSFCEIFGSKKNFSSYSIAETALVMINFYKI